MILSKSPCEESQKLSKLPDLSGKKKKRFLKSFFNNFFKKFKFKEVLECLSKAVLYRINEIKDRMYRRYR